MRYFGVSNFNPLQIALLKKYCRLPIVFNQLQFSPVHTSLVDCGIHVNTSEKA
ncbi:MAG: aldo/keto reductase family oxidoreductase, partial [Clostridia bacterium]|nr:aldo/keto reductase family oxidoreductase [Clostridia bacterium]